MNGTPHYIGGIADVSTNVEARGKGLAAILLRYAVLYMHHIGLQLSSLHTSNAVPYYQRFGWQTVRRHMYLFKAKRHISQNTSEWHLLTNLNTYAQDANYTSTQHTVIEKFPLSNEVVDELVQLYHQYAAQFDGTIVRDYTYWKSWIESELIHLSQSSTATPMLLVTLREANKSQVKADIVAYAILQFQSAPLDVVAYSDKTQSVKLPNHIFVRDFACRSNTSYSSLNALIQNTLTKIVPTEFDEVFVRIPSPILPQSSEVTPIYTWTDDGMMYRSILSEDGDMDALTKFVETEAISNDQITVLPIITNEKFEQNIHSSTKTPILPEEKRHVFFATDSF
jgi:hypothetical protein